MRDPLVVDAAVKQAVQNPVIIRQIIEQIVLNGSVTLKMQ